LMLSWNLNIGTAYTVYYRVATTINSSVPTVYSATKSRSFTPFDAVINYPMLYVPGSYQGWSPGATNGRLFSYGFNTTYSCIITLNDFTNPTTDFKIAPAANWNNSWGCNLTKTGNNYSGTLDPSGGNMTVTAGTYIVTVNTSTMAITLTKTDIWGIIGDGVPVTGWNSDQKMFYNGQRKMWEITITLQVGTIKFRANSDWGLNYGSNAGDGNLQQGGANIPITSAGNYLVRFSTEKMIYTLHKN